MDDLIRIVFWGGVAFYAVFLMWKFAEGKEKPTQDPKKVYVEIAEIIVGSSLHFRKDFEDEDNQVRVKIGAEVIYLALSQFDQTAFAILGEEKRNEYWNKVHDKVLLEFVHCYWEHETSDEFINEKLLELHKALELRMKIYGQCDSIKGEKGQISPPAGSKMYAFQ